MKNKVSDLNNHLFAQLEKLGDEMDKETMELEISRAKAMTGLAGQIIDSYRVSVEVIKLAEKQGYSIAQTEAGKLFISAPKTDQSPVTNHQ